MSQPAPLGIVVALLAEAQTLRGVSGALVEISGPGPDNAAAAAERLLARGAGALMAWGTAGALVPGFSAGALLITAEVRDNEEQTPRQESAPLAEALAIACAKLSPARGLLCTVSRPLCQRSEKAELAQRTGALMVDMESAAVATIAQRAMRPFAAVRAVVDPFDFEIPPAALAGMGADGSSSPWPVLVGLMRNPGQLISLCRLGLHFRSALKTLAAAATLLEHLPAPMRVET